MASEGAGWDSKEELAARGREWVNRCQQCALVLLPLLLLHARALHTLLTCELGEGLGVHAIQAGLAQLLQGAAQAQHAAHAILLYQ